MSRVRLHIPKVRLARGAVALEPEEIAYLVRVRRLADGAALTVFDGEGTEVSATLAADGASLRLGERRTLTTIQRFRFELWQALAKGDKLDLVVQKATELGAARIVPFSSARVVVKLSGERAAARQKRLAKIAQESARQCGRAEVPQVAPLASLYDFVALAGPGMLRAILYEREGNRRLWPWLGRVHDGATVALAVGPEGASHPTRLPRPRGPAWRFWGWGTLSCARRPRGSRPARWPRWLRARSRRSTDSVVPTLRRRRHSSACCQAVGKVLSPHFPWALPNWSSSARSCSCSPGCFGRCSGWCATLSNDSCSVASTAG